MISGLQLKFGRVPESPGEPISATPITVFVGPNNSGKSRALNEIAQYCRSGTGERNFLILNGLDFDGVDEETARRIIERIRHQPNPTNANDERFVYLSAKDHQERVPYDDLLSLLIQPNRSLKNFCARYLKHDILMLDGTTRLNLVNQQVAGDLQRPPVSSIQRLVHSRSKREEVRRIIYEAIGRYFVIDPTGMSRLRIRLSDREPSSELEEIGIHPEARDFHRNAQEVTQYSDGVKAYIGIITEVIAGDPGVILIDEPEAFLHPPLSYKLGLELSRAAKSTDKRIFASTHSPQFVMGCIQSGVPVNIIRLSYRGGIATARVLQSDQLQSLMRDPLLRSTNVLSALFYEFVVVTEADSDRAFYQEINERLLQFTDERGIQNCLFLNAQNKQTLQRIVGPIRQIGIPAVAIPDIDVLKDGGDDWKNLLKSASVPKIDCESLGTARNRINAALRATGKDMKQGGGLALLDKDERKSGERLLQQLSDYGIFVVPGGECESWLKSELALDSKLHGSQWLISAFRKMGIDPEEENYVRPTDNDVWEFMSKVKQWLVNPQRQGIPD